MALFSPGNKPTRSVTLPDLNGATGWKLFNAAGFLVAEIDSQGNLKMKGDVVKI